MTYGILALTTLCVGSSASSPRAEAPKIAPKDRAEAQPHEQAQRRTRFPFVRQLDEMDCGVACLAMVCRYYGREVAPAHIRMAVGTGADGTSLRGIQRGGEHVGLEVRTARAEAESLPFADASFDLVLGHAVLHHLPNLRRAFAEFHRARGVDPESMR